MLWYELHYFDAATGTWVVFTHDTQEEARTELTDITSEREVNSWYITEVKVVAMQL